MEREMVVKLADNIISPLGVTTEENYRAVKAGHSALRLHEGVPGIPIPFYASLIDENILTVEGDYTKFERMCIQSVAAALAQCDIDASSDRVLFIVSTTKANVSLLAGGRYPAGSNLPSSVLPGVAASRIASYFSNHRTPLVVSNACISGVCAQIEALRALEHGLCDYAVVVGADVQSAFIVTGFQALKAVSAEACRPFDRDRKGLNLGEAAATVIYGRSDTADNRWQMVCGAVRNDANHISGPSRTGEGSYLALRSVLQHITPDEIAFISAHGTATLYNDEMESIAVERAGMTDTPVGSLKGCYGHTMGAAGVLETLLSMSAVDDHTVLGTRGFENLGVSRPISVSSENRTTDRHAFIKLISGFGGCNAAAAFKKGGVR